MNGVLTIGCPFCQGEYTFRGDLRTLPCPCGASATYSEESGRFTFERDGEQIVAGGYAWSAYGGHVPTTKI